MKEEYSEYPLDFEGLHFVRIIARYEKGLADFVVIYFAIERNGRMPLVTYDSSHGFFHKDLRYLPRGSIGRKMKLPDFSVKDLLAFAIEDVHRNWQKYYSEYRHEKEATKP
ncbi:MAG: hypothetical protein AABX01_07860 [Candidatus Micrarchaeota archaeon]